MANKNRPLGIVLITIYSGISAILAIVAGFLMALSGSLPEVPAWITLVGVVFLFMGVLLVASMYGLWSFQSWAPNLTKWLFLASIPLGIASIFPIYPDSEMTTGNTVFQLFGIGLAGYIVYYVTRPHIYNIYQN